MAYIGKSPEYDAVTASYELTATEGQTDFVVDHGSSSEVFVNGLKMSKAEYSYLDATTIRLASGLTAGDIVVVMANTPFYSDGHYSKVELDGGQLDNRYYTEIEVDSRLDLKANTADVYSKVEVDAKLALKQDTLVSGTSIKTINGESLLGGGNIVTPTIPTATSQLTNDSGFITAAEAGGELATLSKSFVTNEEYDITLSKDVTAPSVAVYKEVPQLDTTSNTWDVSGSNYEVEDFALDTDLDVIVISTNTSKATPDMTSNTSPSGTVFGSGDYGTNYMWEAFEGDTVAQTWWRINTTSGYIGYQFDTPIVINKYALKDESYSTLRSIKDWTLEGSNNGVDYVTLDAQTDITNWVNDNSYKEFSFSNTTAYTYYKIVFTANNGDSTYVEIAEIKLYEEEILNQFTLSSGSFTADNVGMRIVGNGGEAILTATDGSYESVVPFNDTSTIASGNWSLVGLNNSVDGISISSTYSPNSILYVDKYYNPTLDNRSSVIAKIDENQTLLAYSSTSNSNAIWVELKNNNDFTTYVARYDNGSTNFRGLAIDFEPISKKFVVGAINTDSSCLGAIVGTVSSTSISVARNDTALRDVSSSLTTTSHTCSGVHFLSDTSKYIIGHGKKVYVFSESSSSALTETPFTVDGYYSSLLKVDTDEFVFISHYYGSDALTINHFSVDPTSGAITVINTNTQDGLTGLSTTVTSVSAAYNSNTIVSTISDVSSKDVKIHSYDLSTHSTINTITAPFTSTYDYSEGGSLAPVAYSSVLDKFVIAKANTAYMYDSDLNYAYQIENIHPSSNLYYIQSDGFKFYDDVIYIVGCSTSYYINAVISTPIITRYSVLDKYLPAITNTSGQINSTYWADINSMTATETLNNQTVNYAVSTDNRTTWSVAKSGEGVRNIVRNNGGTWEYNEAIDIGAEQKATPIMTSDTAPSGVVTYGSFVSDLYKGYFAFNENTADRWQCYMYGSSDTWWLSYQFTEPKRIVKYKVTGEQTKRFPKDWRIEASNDGTNWTTIDTVSNQTGWTDFVPREFVVDAPGNYLYYRFYLLDNNGDLGSTIISELEYIEEPYDYTTSETWTPATTNNEFQALSEAMSISINQMPSTQLEALQDSEYFTLGDTLDLTQILYTDNSTETPIADGVSINYDGYSKYQQATVNTDYEVAQFDSPTGVDGTNVRIKALADNNLKIRIV